VKTFIGSIMVYDLPMGNLGKGEPVMIYNYTNKMSAKINRLIAIIDEKTGEVIKKSPKWLQPEQFAQVQIRLDEPMCMELFANYKNMGRFAIRKSSH
jgi:elongation factor 1 alpha-like protein